VAVADHLIFAGHGDTEAHLDLAYEPTGANRPDFDQNNDHTFNKTIYWPWLTI